MTIDEAPLDIQTAGAFTTTEGTSVAFSWEKIVADESWDKGFFIFGVPEQLYGKKYTFGSGSETFPGMKPYVCYKADEASAAISASEGDGGIEGEIEYKAINLTFIPLTSTSVSFYVKYDITFGGKHFEGSYEGAVQRTVKVPGEGVALIPYTAGFLADTKNPTPATPTNSVTIGKQTIPQQNLLPGFENDGEKMINIHLGEFGDITLPVILQGHTIDLGKYYTPFTSPAHNWSVLFDAAGSRIEITGSQTPEQRPIKSGYLYVSPTEEGRLNLAFAIILSDESSIKGDLTDISKTAE